MSALAVTVDLRGLAAADQLFARLAPLDEARLLDGLARRIQEQTRTRIEDGKRSPAGVAWQANREGSSILYRSGALARSIDYAVRGARAVVGSGLVYAAIHQFGGIIKPKTANTLVFTSGNAIIFAGKVTIPARPYIGVSAENASELTAIAIAFIRRRLGLGSGK